MTKTYELPKGRKIVAEFDENGIAKITEQALDSIICELNEYAEQEPTCNTCKYTTAAFMPCNACKDKSEFEPQESEDKG